MKRWIDSDSDLDQSTSNLPVLPPTAREENNIPMAIPIPEDPVRNSSTEVTGTTVDRSPPRDSDQTTHRKKRNSKRESEASSGKRWRRSESRQGLPSVSPLYRGRSVQIATEEAHDELSEENDSLRNQLQRGLPSWLVSFIVHVALLLLLAILTIGAANGPDIIGLEISESEKTPDVMMVDTEIQLDDVDIELESSSALQPDQEEFEVDSETDMAQQVLDDIRALAADASNGSASDDLVQLSRGDGKSVQFFGVGAEGTNFVFVIDCSGSMGGGRWYTAKRELRAAIDTLRSKQSYYVFLYNSFTYTMTTHDPRLVRATGKNRKETGKWLETHLPNGDTKPKSAMIAALNLKPDAIFLLSDGELKDDTIDYLMLANKKSYEGDQIPIHTIFLGNGFGKDVMKTIAADNNGTFRHVRH